MSTHEERFPNWNQIYKDDPVESMPWYSPGLDQDVAKILDASKLAHGDFLDIGTGPATQALRLSERGFAVTATDISAAAIDRAKTLSAKINFMVDNILETKLAGPFDFALDRGCFHVLPPQERFKYVENLHRLLKPQGKLFLKCFSKKEPETGVGPYRFCPEEIDKIFQHRFKLVLSEESGFKGTVDQGRKALFSILQRI